MAAVNEGDEIVAATQEEKIAFLAERGYSPVTVNSGCHLYYKLHGNPEAPHKMVIISGTSSCGHYHDNFVALLLSEPEWENELQICTFDPRGCGESSDPPGVYTTAGLGKDVTDLMDHLNWERAHIIGVSLGGMIAQEVALGAPARVVSLSLVVTSARGAGCSDMTALGTITRNMFESDSRKKLTRTMKMLFSSAALADPESDRYHRLFAVLEERVRTVGEPNVSTVAALAQAWAATTHFISKARLKTLVGFRIPTIVLGASEDHLVAPTRQRALAEMLECKLVTVQAGHAMLVEAPGDAVRAVSELMQSGTIAL